MGTRGRSRRRIGGCAGREVIMEFTYNKLRGRIVEKYQTQANFAQAVGISKNAMSNKITGKTGLSQEDIVLWAQLLDIDRQFYGEYFFS